MNPQHFQAFFGLGNSLRDSSRLREALASYKKALEIKPDYVEIYRGMGEAYKYNGEFEKAIECFARSASINSDLSQENLNIGSIIQSRGNPDLALQHYIKGTKKDTDLGEEKSNQKIVALHFTARGGALFLHSLFDGHPEISTLPGVYFKGWFGNETWDSLAPNPDDKFWHDKLANTIIEKHKPLFDATNKNNVVGEPFGKSSWLAKASGFMDLGDNGAVETPADVPLSALLPAFITSELKTAFQIGFLLFLPFLVIDMVVASVLMSLGMMMLSPMLVAMPFKLLLFVLVDGWTMTVGSLVATYVV